MGGWGEKGCEELGEQEVTIRNLDGQGLTGVEGVQVVPQVRIELRGRPQVCLVERKPLKLRPRDRGEEV